MFSLSVSGLLKLAGMHPLLQALAIVLGTFVLEDVATVLAAMEVQDGNVVWFVALAALYAGIVLGDFGLYGMGRLAALAPWVRHLLPDDRRLRSREWLERRVFRVVFISRFVPGARLPTYTGCGYLRASFSRFAVAAVLATSVWTTLLFVLSRHVGSLLIAHLGTWRWVGAVVFALLIVLMGRTLVMLRGERG